MGLRADTEHRISAANMDEERKFNVQLRTCSASYPIRVVNFETFVRFATLI